MPHIIIEYSRNIGDIIDVSKLVYDMHEKLADQGIDKARIKTRAVVCNSAAIGERGSRGHMLHATLLILAGRDNATKKEYGDALHSLMQTYVVGLVENCSVTLEIRDMDPDNYYM